MKRKKYKKIFLCILISIVLITLVVYIMYHKSNNLSKSDNITDIANKCKSTFEEYYDLQETLSSCGGLELLKKLDLISQTQNLDEYESIRYTYDDFEKTNMLGDFYKTNIKYSKFKKAMLKYMTNEFFLKSFENTVAYNMNGYLTIISFGGTASYLDIDKFELVYNNKSSYTFNILAKEHYDDCPDINTINMQVTFEKQNGNYVVSNVEFK